MRNIAQYRDCGTAGIRPLDLQLIAQIKRIAPSVLVSFEHLPITIGSGCHPYLQAPALRALEKAIAERPNVRMVCNSAYRTVAQQAVLYNHCQHRRCGIKAAAVPGKSNHNTGLALDIEDAQGWKPYLERAGWDWIGSFDPMHFDYEGRGTKDLRWLSIKAFQQLWNFNHLDKLIAEDGSWGPSTQNAIFSTSCNGFLRSPGGTVPDYPPNIAGSLREGMSGELVRSLQKAINSKGVAVQMDSVFGPGTVAAVKKIQIKNGLTADGVVGAATKRVLGLA